MVVDPPKWSPIPVLTGLDEDADVTNAVATTPTSHQKKKTVVNNINTT